MLLSAVFEESADEGFAEAAALGAGVDVQFGQFEIAGQKFGNAVVVGPHAAQTRDDLLLPPLVGGAAVAVGDTEHRRAAQSRCARGGVLGTGPGFCAS